MRHQFSSSILDSIKLASAIISEVCSELGIPSNAGRTYGDRLCERFFGRRIEGNYIRWTDPQDGRWYFSGNRLVTRHGEAVMVEGVWTHWDQACCAVVAAEYFGLGGEPVTLGACRILAGTLCSAPLPQGNWPDTMRMVTR